MTSLYEALEDQPQTGITVSGLAPDERQELRRIQVRGTTGLQQESSGNFTDVYYLAGDEQAAAKCFVAENRELLTNIDFSKRNVVQTSVDRLVFDWILDALGERELIKYETVVLEARSDGTQWVINRERFDTAPNRRYTINEGVSARVDSSMSLQSLYNAYDGIITETKLRQNESVSGDVRQILDYYRVAPEYACRPISTEKKELAVQKQ